MANIYFFFLGSHPSLSAAETWLALQAANYSPQLIAANERFLLVELSQELPASFLPRLGGVGRIAQLLAKQPRPWATQDILPYLPGKTKFTLGISDKNLANELKQLVRESGGRMKFLLPKGRSTLLNAAQVIFNKLTQPPNIELLLIRHRHQYYLAKTLQIQDIEAYEYRDTRRPQRPGKVGLLPPKLAQIMLSLSTAGLPADLYDPFCGAGTVLQEGWLLGYQMTGSDIDPSMIAATQVNLDWLHERFSLDQSLTPKIFQHDVRQPFPEKLRARFDAIVSEPYLGAALTSPLPHSKIESVMTELGNLYLAFFKHAHAVLKPGGTILFILPAFAHKKDFWLFPEGFLDEITRLGYSQQQLIPAELASFYPSGSRKTLFYSRPDALVGRELTFWKKDNGT